VSWPWYAGLLLSAPHVALPLAGLIQGRPKPDLADYPPLPAGRCPLVSVIIPARNESRNIERCVGSVLASEYPNLEVLVVDDRSTDETAAVVERLAAADSRLQLIRGGELPEGWFGKPWACWQGYQRARGTLLLFTDADTLHGPELLPRAVALLETDRADLVTVMPRQEMETFWERVVQPHFFLLILLRYGSLSHTANTRDPRFAIANGQFILVTEESYEDVGGHRAVSDQVVEDLALAQEYTRLRRRRRFATADRYMTTRMYTSLPEIVEGWSKNVFEGIRKSAAVSVRRAYALVLVALALPLLWLAPLAAVPVWLATGSGAALAFAAAGIGGSVLTFAIMLSRNGAPLRYSLTYPLGAAAQAWILLRSAARGPGRIVWKGRTYRKSAARGEQMLERSDTGP
jgi:chlorobactene glucosyltransferase